jgi:hypothetical protein
VYFFIISLISFCAENNPDQWYQSRLFLVVFFSACPRRGLSIASQRDEMMENFFHILQCLPIATDTSSSSSHFGGTSPFKVQVNFDISVFEGRIDAKALDKWLNLLEGYFSVHKFFDKEKITFTFLKVLPHVKHWWETYWEQSSTEESELYGVDPTWNFFVDAVKEQY